MPIVSFLNQKGGVGKTTLAINITREFTLKGKKTLLVDTDPQGSAMDWHERSNGDLIDLVCLSKPTLRKDVIKFKPMYEWIFIDGIGKIDAMTSSAIACSDLVLIPIQPSAVDVWSSQKVVQLVEERRAITAGSPDAFFIISQDLINTNLSKNIDELLAEYMFPAFKSRTYARVAFAESIMRGKTVHDWNDKKALYEIEQLGNEIKNLCSWGYRWQS